MFEKKITFDSFIRGILSILVIVAILYLINKLSGALLPFFIAWLLAYLIYPLVKFFQYNMRIKNRSVSIIIALLVVISVITTAAWFFIPSIIEEFAKLKNLLVQYMAQESSNVTIPGIIEHLIKEKIDLTHVNHFFSEEHMQSIIQNALPKMWTILYNSVNFVFSIFASFIILLYIFFILLDYENINNNWIKLIPTKHRNFVKLVATDVEVGMNRYFRGQALVALLVGILFSIGFLIIDFPLAIGFGLFIGLLNMVPYLQLIAFIPTILLALLKAADTGENFWGILALAILVFCVVQIIQDAIIVPKVMGKITGLNPAVILLSLSIWGSLLGIIGMIIALPLTTIILSYYKRYIITGEHIPQTQANSEKDEKAFTQHNESAYQTENTNSKKDV